ncbi:MAG TPA: hypothetical protein VMF53_11160 [Alphaproteobacteria bacterium]|nr:hypothetical protein [Alphaproteobacteria bacterium]
MTISGEWSDGGDAQIGQANQSPRAHGRGRQVVIQNPDGSTEIRTGGTISWRNNDPGNMHSGSFTAGAGQIGTNGVLAVFPDYATGYNALTSRLGSPEWSDKTLGQALHDWAPPNENDTARYIAAISARTGLSQNRTLGSMNAAQIDSVAQAIQHQEGWKAGTVSRSGAS